MMCVLVVNVRVVRMGVADHRMPMRMTMGFAGRIVCAVFMLMTFVMNMSMFVK